MWKEEEILKILTVSPCLSLVAVFENRDFAFAAREEPADVFLVREDNKQGNGNGKDPVGDIVYIKNDQNENRKSHACQYGTQGNKTGQVKNHQENGYATQGC